MGIRMAGVTDPNTQRMAADVAATGVIIASWASLLPAAAAGFAIFWYCLQIYTWIENRFRSPKKKRRPTKGRR